jgi:NADPH:quinone reductase-like Zn-dependent oxidoreductase
VIDDGNLQSHIADALRDHELDLVVDSIGGAATRELVHRLRFGGTLVSYAVLSGRTDSADILDLIGRQVNWTGFWEINWLRRTEPTLVQKAYLDVVELVADGTLSTRVDRTMGLDDWRVAIQLSQDTAGRDGKIMFVPNQQPT